tara:strand:- start:87 stop:365 length:279 start_codon:yes stop_codon:yes gene_type:complete
MNALHIKILRLLTLVKILDPTMGEFQGVSQICRAALPGLLQLNRWNAQWLRTETVELFSQRNQGTVTFMADAFDDGFDRCSRLPLGLTSGAG